MLAIEIAAGIVLASLIINYWRKMLSLAFEILLGAALIFYIVYYFANGRTFSIPGMIFGGLFLWGFLEFYTWRWDRRAAEKKAKKNNFN